MGTVPSIPTFSPTSGASSSQLTELAAAASFALNPPRALVYKSSSTSIASSNGPQAISWTTAINNTDGIWSSGTNPSRLTCNTAGLYDIEAALHYTAFTGGEFQIGVALNSASTWPSAGSADRLMEQVTPANPNTSLGEGGNLKFEWFLNVGDYVELFTCQNSGSTQTATPSGTYFDGHFGMRWTAQS